MNFTNFLIKPDNVLPLVINIEEETLKNIFYRRVIHTGKFIQLVLMSIFPGRDIAVETHTGDQFIRIEKGTGIVVLDGVQYEIYDGVSINIPAGIEHYFKNTANEDMKLYSIYSLPEHSPTKVQIMDPITGEIQTISE